MSMTDPDEVCDGDLELPADLTGTGLAPQVWSAYATLVRRGPCPVEDLNSLLNVAEPRFLMEKLLDEGLLEVSAGIVHPQSPRAGLIGRIEDEEASLARRRAELQSSRTAAERLAQEFDRTRVFRDDAVEILKDRHTVIDRINDLMRSTVSDVASMVTTEQSPQALAAARAGDLALIDRGIQMRTIVLAGHLRKSRELLDYQLQMVEAGAYVHVASTLPTRLSLWDKSAALLPTDPLSPGTGACLTTLPGLVDALVQTFERTWENSSQPLQKYVASRSGAEESAEDGWTPSVLESEVLRLLASGHKDESIARRVGMSLRSVRRVIAKISEELDTSSRFQMGVRAMQRGFL